MDFDDAIQAHVHWKKKLATYIAKPDHSLNAAACSSDANCELGKWLRAEGRQYAAVPDFVKLVADHARFHKAAGDVVSKADAGQKMTEEVLLGAKSDYADASSAVVSSLMKVKRVTQTH